MLKTWKLDLRRRALLEWTDVGPVMAGVQVRLVSNSRHKNAGTVYPVELDLERLKLVPKGRREPSIPESSRLTENPGLSVLLTEPGHYRCVSEGSVGEPLIVVVTVRAIGALRGKEDYPLFYQSEEEAQVALAVPQLLKGSESQKDLAVSLISGGVASLPLGRVVLAYDHWCAVGLPSLSGTLKQIAWVSVLRDEVVAKIDAAEQSQGKEKTKMETLLSPSNWRRFYSMTPKERADLEEASTLTFVQLRAELQHAVDAETWIRCRSDLLQWLAGRALERRWQPVLPF